MRQWARYGYLVSLLLFMAGLVFQVYLVGQSLFVNPRDWTSHVGWGWTVAHGIPLLILISGALSGLGRRRWAVLAALLVSAAVQPFLALARTDNPAVAALHPVNALVLFGLTGWLLLDGWRLARAVETPSGT